MENTMFNKLYWFTLGIGLFMLSAALFAGPVAYGAPMTRMEANQFCAGYAAVETADHFKLPAEGHRQASMAVEANPAAKIYSRKLYDHCVKLRGKVKLTREVN
jgi:hypothetical protein